MPEWLTWKRAAAVALLLSALAGTHWLAYQTGARRQRDKTSAFLQSFMADCEKDALRTRLDSLRLLAKHAQQTSAEEILLFCKQTEVLADAVERSVVAPARQAENDPVADRWQREVDEARRLSALLKKREKR
jgi:hypothetical protein